MKAVVYRQTGDSSVLQVSERPVPTPGPAEVVVAVAVSGVNPTDWKARRGPGRLDHGQVPNQDGAGVVHAVGPGVTGHKVGDRVWLWDVAFDSTEGTAQEFAVVPEAHAVAMADSVSFDVGASLGIPALTAHRTLTAGIDGPDQLSAGALLGTTVLVAGGAGAVGHAAIQLATWAGATVITTVSSAEKARLAAAAGAAHVVDYRKTDVVASVLEIAPDGVDLVVEVNPSANLMADLELVADNATIAIYAAGEPDTITLPGRTAMVRNTRLQFVLTYTTTAAQKTAAIAAVARAADEGILEVGESAGLPLRRFPLAETAAAHDLVEAGFVGKVLIDIDRETHASS